jgi:TnpA family transposase
MAGLGPLIDGSIHNMLIEQQFSEVLRLAASIQQGTVSASLILRKLGAYPRQNSLALAPREIGRIQLTLFTLAWLVGPALRRRVTAGLNKGEARNSLARAVFFNRLGEIRDRSFENQQHRANGLNLVVAAITLWNTVYPERAATLLAKSTAFDSALLAASLAARLGALSVHKFRFLRGPLLLAESQRQADGASRKH